MKTRNIQVGARLPLTRPEYRATSSSRGEVKRRRVPPFI